MDEPRPTHLSLSVLPSTYWPYCIQGDCEHEIGCHYASARDAESAVRAFCREHGYTATMRVFTPRNKLWKEDHIAAAGSVTRTTPRWLLETQKIAQTNAAPTSRVLKP